MRATLALLGKDAREHARTALALAAATLVVVLVALGQNRAAAFSMSPFEVVRFALLTYLPLVALIVGNRLVVREYLARTRLFVEALPIPSSRPLVLKYLLGLGYLALLTALLVALAARAAGIADDVTADYVLLMAGKSLALVALYWSIVFCYSLCGHLRVVLYVLTIGAVAFVAFWPGIDQELVPPFALLDDQLFVFERDVVPWRDIAGTVLLAALFTAFGFVLGRLGEGAVAERLARPMTRTDHVAIGVLLLAGGVAASVLIDDEERESIAFTSGATLRSDAPPVAVFHVDERYREAGRTMLERTSASVASLQAALGVPAVPTIRIALAPELEPDDVYYSTLDGVLVRADWLAHDDYDLAVLDAVVLHGALGTLSGERAMFEPYHWVLDGVARWWAERGHPEGTEAREAELVARALHVLGRAGEANDLVDDWQPLADRFAYPSAEAFAWSAIRYVELERGEEAVLALARRFFGTPLGGNSLDALRDRRVPTMERFEDATGLDRDDFVTGWHAWLKARAADPAVAAFLDAVPPITGVVRAGADEGGVYRLVGDYRPLDGVDVATAEAELADALAAEPALLCVMKHDVLGPFDNEFDVDQGRDPRTRDVGDCALGRAGPGAGSDAPAVHDVGSRYAPGQRVYVAFDLEEGAFHQPLRLDAWRVTLPDTPLPAAPANEPEAALGEPPAAPHIAGSRAVAVLSPTDAANR